SRECRPSRQVQSILGLLAVAQAASPVCSTGCPCATRRARGSTWPASPTRFFCLQERAAFRRRATLPEGAFHVPTRGAGGSRLRGQPEGGQVLADQVQVPQVESPVFAAGDEGFSVRVKEQGAHAGLGPLPMEQVSPGVHIPEANQPI